MRCLKMFLFQFVLLISLFGTTVGQTARMITYNIRYANPNDGDNIWENRKGKLAGLINYYEPSFLGIQEGLLHQVEYLDSCLSMYYYIGVGRDDGKQKGEYCAIFYDTRTYEVIIDSTFWLSETPGIPSNGWDAKLNRVCTYGLFENLNTKERIWVMNTHFDHRGKMARENSASLISKRVVQINRDNLPLVLMGDFNNTLADGVLSHLLTNSLRFASSIDCDAYLAKYCLNDAWDLFQHVLSNEESDIDEASEIDETALEITLKEKVARTPTHYFGGGGSVLDYILLSCEFDASYHDSLFQVSAYDTYDRHLINPIFDRDGESTDHGIVLVTLTLRS